MLGKELLQAGQMADVMGPVNEYHGFRLQRHISDEATVITYKAADGSMKRMAVLDAKDRAVCQFGAYKRDSSLANFAGGSINNSERIVYNAVPLSIEQRNSQLSAMINNGAIYEEWGEGLKADLTARENCDVWMQWCYSTSYAPGWCRSKILDGTLCDVPNLYEAMTIWACSDMLDEMDKSAGAFPRLLLGYRSTASSTIGRKQMSANGDISQALWSSTEVSSDAVRRVFHDGSCGLHYKNYNGTAVPILELD